MRSLVYEAPCFLPKQGVFLLKKPSNSCSFKKIKSFSKKLFSLHNKVWYNKVVLVMFLRASFEERDRL
jgi:hypothetical protein